MGSSQRPTKLQRANRALRVRLRRSPLLREIVVARRHAGLTPRDGFVASYPRSGNTWLRFLLADLVVGAPVGFETLEQVVPQIGLQPGVSPVTAHGGRLIKTHEPYRSEYGRAVYLVRDARDVLVSWYRVTRDDPDDLSGLDAFVDRFVTRHASPYGAWHDHVRSWLAAAAADDGVRVYRFESMRRDPVPVIAQIAAHLGLRSDEPAIELAVERNSAADMRRREAESVAFLRRFGYRSQGVRDGSGGDWRALLAGVHLDRLAPVLELNFQLGYGDDGPLDSRIDPARVSARGSSARS